VTSPSNGEQETPDEQDLTLRVVHGKPDDDELAAMVAVVAALSATMATDVPTMTSRSGWSDAVARVRAPLRPGPGAWRRSGLPR
jgi:acyl-CoA carboxylase epsilon subunit